MFVVASSTENTYQNYQLPYGRTEVRSCKIPHLFFCLCMIPSLLELSSVSGLLSESFRPRVVIYSKIDHSLSRPRWFYCRLERYGPSFPENLVLEAFVTPSGLAFHLRPFGDYPGCQRAFFSFGVIYKIPSHFEGKKKTLWSRPLRTSLP